MSDFSWKPDGYLDLIRGEIPRYEELQEQAIAAIPFAPERVLELGMGTGETTRRLIEAYPDSWVVGLDSPRTWSTAPARCTTTFSWRGSRTRCRTAPGTW